MTANSRLAIPALLLLAARGDATGPGLERTLIGRWGSNDALLVGLRVAAELRVGCSSVGTDDPVLLDPDGTFSFEGVYLASGAYTNPPRARVTGRIDIEGQVVTLSVDVQRDGWPSFDFVLRQGVDPGFDTEPPMCPQ
jgi:hypothetical protein